MGNKKSQTKQSDSPQQLHSTQQEQIHKMMALADKKCPDDAIFKNWKNWCIFPFSLSQHHAQYCDAVYLGDMFKFTIKKAAHNNVENILKLLNDYTPLHGALCNIIIEMVIDSNVLLTKIVSNDNYVSLNGFLNDWKICSSSSQCYQILLHHDVNNDNMINNILLISGCKLLSTKRYYPSIRNVLCLEIKFRLFSIDAVTINMNSSSYWSTYRKSSQCCLIPARNEISIGTEVISEATTIKEICNNNGEHHILIKDDSFVVTMEYIVGDVSLYKISMNREIPYYRSQECTQISIKNGDGNNDFMLITELKLYSQPDVEENT